MIEHWQAPQWIFAAIIGLNVIMAVGTHNKPREPNNGFVTLFASAMTTALLWWGGFWS